MTKNNPSPFSDAQIALYDALIKDHKDIERKGAAMPYTSMNGNMFSFLSKDGMLHLRLPENERNQLIKEYKTSLTEQHGAVLKEYVAIPQKLFENTTKLKPYFAASVAYAKTLKPKPTTKKKK